MDIWYIEVKDEANKCHDHCYSKSTTRPKLTWIITQHVKSKPFFITKSADPRTVHRHVNRCELNKHSRTYEFLNPNGNQAQINTQSKQPSTNGQKVPYPIAIDAIILIIIFFHKQNALITYYIGSTLYALSCYKIANSEPLWP